MSPDEGAFLAAFQAAPDDEAPHRVFADWLEERGRDEEAAYHRRWTVEVRKAEEWLDAFARRCGDHVENYDEVYRGYWDRIRNTQPTSPEGLAARREASAWLTANEKRIPFTRDLVVAAAREWLRTKDDEEYGPEEFTQLGDEKARALMSDPATRTEFWQNFSVATGTPVAPEVAAEGKFFSCSC